MPHPATPHRPTPAAAPLWAVLAFTWLNSFATGSTFNGVFFITRRVYQFDNTQNLLLGLLMGGTYVVGALSAGPLMRRAQSMGGLSPRKVLLGLMLIGAALCMLPVAAWYLTPEASRAATSWSVWVFVGCYSILCGSLWPVIESFLSGGRTGHSLRSATGRFNVVWSSALVIALWAMAPFIEHNALATPALCAGIHLLAIGVLIRFPTRPGRHLAEHHEHVPAVYSSLLRVHRVLLPTSYTVMYALNPVLPGVLESLQVPTHLLTVAASTWQVTRVITFFALDRWHGWHGRWLTATVAPVLLLGGFAAVVLSPRLGHDAPAIITALAGLILFGCGTASIYTAALYYALEVGAAEVEAGGMHEAMIGVGYTLGPACGLIPIALGAPADSTQSGMLLMVGMTSGVGLAAAWTVRAPRGMPDSHRKAPSTPDPAHAPPNPARSH